MVLANLIKKSAMGGVTLMGLSLLSQPAQALDWNFSYSASNNFLGGTDTASFAGILSTDGTSPVQQSQTYTISSATGTLTYNGTTESISAASGTFQWDGSTGILLTLNGGIQFTTTTPLGKINCVSVDCTASPDNYAPGFFVQENTGGDALLISSNNLTATAVPWETDALPVVGSTIFFAGGLWAKRKFAKPLQK
jgi:hypothetical protein